MVLNVEKVIFARENFFLARSYSIMWGLTEGRIYIDGHNIAEKPLEIHNVVQNVTNHLNYFFKFIFVVSRVAEFVVLYKL